MKKYAMLMLAAMLTLSLSISAQNGQRAQRGQRGNNAPRQEFTAKDRAERMTKQLELTADQKEKVQALFEKQDAKRAEQMAKFREKGNQNVNREEMRALRENQMKENQTELEKIIGKEKAEKWNSMRRERPERQNMPQRKSEGKKV